MPKVRRAVLISLLIVLTFGGCSDKDVTDETKNNSEQAAITQATEVVSQDNFVYECDDDIVYTDEQLEEIIATDLTKKELFQAYPTPYMVEYESNSNSKLVYYSNTSVATVSFDKKGNRVKIFAETRKNISVSKKEFETLKVGDSFENVVALDPNGDYTAWYWGGAANRPSQHFTSDKYEITIYYDGDDNIYQIITIPMTKTDDGSLS